MDGYEIKVEDKPTLEDIQVLRHGLSEFNFAQAGQRGQFISVFLRNDQQQIVGGAYGWTAFGWLHVDVLWLDENIRHKRLGRQVLQATEAEAMRRGCRFAKLETFSFQALDFYKKNGYTVFAELDQVAGGHRWYFLKKKLS
jgi:GNAT superfamily N-acetyltransferase